jgi:hypothetical protein
VGDRLARFGVAWIERYLSVCGFSVEALHDRGDESLLGELMDDFMVLVASFSGRFYQLRQGQSAASARCCRRAAGAMSIGAGKAARILGVRAADIQRVTRTSQVTMAQVQAWRAEPPDWLTVAREGKRRRDEHRKRRAAARRGRRADDQRLCPPAVAQRLGVGYREVAAAMRAAGDARSLDTHTVEGWLSGASCVRGMPAWLSELLAAAAAEAAQREARAQSEALEAAHRRLLAEERVQAKLLAGKRRFGGAELEVVQECAFYAAKELVRNDGDVDELEAAVLAAVGVRAEVHSSWPIHCGGCDRAGADGCDARIAELAAQRFEAAEAARHQRRERARADAERIAAGALRVGQYVLAYYDTRAAVVTKTNRVTVKVKHVGGQADGYQLVEKNYSPTYLHRLPDDVAAAVSGVGPGDAVVFTDWGGRARHGTVTDIEGPLLRVDYRLASGQPRSTWIDALHLEAGPPDPVGARTMSC